MNEEQLFHLFMRYYHTGRSEGSSHNAACVWALNQVRDYLRGTIGEWFTSSEILAIIIGKTTK